MKPRTTLSHFLAKAFAKHGETYDYQQVEYNGSVAPVTILCHIHGPFVMRPSQHLAGYGCQKCGMKRVGSYRKLDTATFIERAIKKHGNLYDYSKALWQGSKMPITIGCPAHGFYKHPAYVHLRGIACPACTGGRGGSSAKNWVLQADGKKCFLYFIRVFNELESFYKVGVTVLPVKQRFNRGVLSGYQFEVLAIHASYNAAAVFDWEQSIIQSFAHLQYVPKQQFGGQFECFSSCEEILEIFPL